MIEIAGSLKIFDKVFKGGKYLYQLYKKNPAYYLKGSLSSGLQVAYRIIALFEAHNVKRTQIYQILGDKFPEISPAIDAESLKSQLSGSLIQEVSDLFAVRQAWVEGEAGPIYEPLIHYKGLRNFIDFITDLKARNISDHCILIAYKSSATSVDLYNDSPHIALVYAEPLKEIGDKTIYRYYPVHGPFPWTHSPARYHLCAYFNVADNTPGLLLKGRSILSSLVEGIGSGEVIPSRLKVKAEGLWHPEDYGYPESYTIGKLSLEDWESVLKYFGSSAEFQALKTSFK